MSDGWLGPLRKFWDLDLALTALACRAVISIAPRTHWAHVHLGRALRRMGRDREALEALTAALGLQGASVSVLRLLGTNLRRAGDPERAADVLRRAIDAAPTDAASHRELARTLTDMGSPEMARKLAQRALRLSPSALHHEELGRTFLHMHDVVQAETSFEHALALAPRRAETHHLMSRLLRTRGDYQAAQRAARHALKLSPRSRTYRRYAEVLDGELAAYAPAFAPAVAPAPAEPTEPDRILHVIENSLPHRTSGYTYRTQYVLEAQRLGGLRPTAITRPGFPWDQRAANPGHRSEVDGIVYHHVRIDGPPGYNEQPLDHYLDRYAGAVAQRARAHRASLVHAASNFKNGIAAGAAARALGIPWVYEVRGLWEDTLVSKGIVTEGSERYRHYRAMETRCMAQADAVVTLSRTLEAEITARGIDPEKVFVAPNGIDTGHLPPTERDAALAATLGLAGRPVVGYVGAFVGYEGLDLLVDAFAGIASAVPEARLLLVGDGEARAGIAARIERHGLGRRAILTGRVPHRAVLGYYSLIDVFVVPRRDFRVTRLVTPLKPFEAMSTGRAVVVSDLPALAEAVIDGETGRCFRAGDAGALAETCIGLLADDAARARYAMAGARWVRENRTWAATLAAYPEVYAFARARHARASDG